MQTYVEQPTAVCPYHKLYSLCSVIYKGSLFYMLAKMVLPVMVLNLQRWETEVMTACTAWFQIVLFAQSKDYENVKSSYLEAAKDSKGKVRNRNSFYCFHCPEIRFLCIGLFHFHIILMLHILYERWNRMDCTTLTNLGFTVWCRSCFWWWIWRTQNLQCLCLVCTVWTPANQL